MAQMKLFDYGQQAISLFKTIGDIFCTCMDSLLSAKLHCCAVYQQGTALTHSKEFSVFDIPFRSQSFLYLVYYVNELCLWGSQLLTIYN